MYMIYTTPETEIQEEVWGGCVPVLGVDGWMCHDAKIGGSRKASHDAKIGGSRKVNWWVRNFCPKGLLLTQSSSSTSTTVGIVTRRNTRGTFWFT